MLDIGWSELLVIGVVTLIVIGPEDLPRMFRALGRITARARGMAREFTSAMDDAAKSSGIDDAANSLRDLKSMTSKKALGLDALDRAAERFEKWEPQLPRRDAAPKADAATAAPKADAPASAQPAPANSPTPALPDAPDTVADAPGRRQLHAVRRSDTKDL